MSRLHHVFATAAVLALLPLHAAAAPSPSPSLDQVLAAPPASDFNELTTSPLHGKFTAHDWASLSNNTSDAQQTETTLKQDGFVDGYGKTWAQSSSNHALIEAVMAFSGGRGAQSALTAMEKGDKSDSSYKNADTVGGISRYYGAHFVDTTNQVVEDFFGFVKGNDVFGVAFVSTKDDVLSAATQQVQAQYQAAPESTIPRSQWPENTNGSPAFQAGYILGIVLPIIFIAAVVALVAGLIVRRNRRAAVPAYAGFPGGSAPMAGAVQMSPDGNYWWDGQAWKDAAHEVPPDAQRSSDGALWWDGRTWRAVPQAGPPEAPPTG